MKENLIDEYISNFEDLVRMAGYATESAETMAMFLDRVDGGILKNIMKPSVLNDYRPLGQNAIDTTKLWQAVDDILKSQEQGRTNSRFLFHPLQQQQ